MLTRALSGLCVYVCAGNRLEGEGATAVAGALRGLTQLQTLNLSSEKTERARRESIEPRRAPQAQEAPERARETQEGEETV